ncbi:hypothetical protein JCM6882_003864 [Rhodosporidiobolus microsporus]
MSHLAPRKTTTPSFTQLFSAFGWLLKACTLATEQSGVKTNPLPLGSFAVGYAALSYLKPRGHLNPCTGAEEESLEHSIGSLQVLLAQDVGHTGLMPHVPTVLLNELHNVRFRAHVVEAHIRVESRSTNSPDALIPVQLYLSHSGLFELIGHDHLGNFEALLFPQQSPTNGAPVWQFKSIVLVLLELLAWNDHGRNNRHLLNIKVLFEAEEEANAGRAIQLPHTFLHKVEVDRIVHFLNPIVVEHVENLATDVAQDHTADAASWELRNVPGMAAKTTLQLLADGYQDVLYRTKSLLVLPAEAPVHHLTHPLNALSPSQRPLPPHGSPSQYLPQAHHQPPHSFDNEGFDISDFLHEDPEDRQYMRQLSVGKRERRGRRGSVAAYQPEGRRRG